MPSTIVHFIDGTSDAAPATFNHGITSADLSGTFQFSDIPVETIGMTDYFVFTFDAQEPGGMQTPMSITDIMITHATEGSLWDYDQATHGSIDLQGDTDSPMGNGGDISLAVSLSNFQGYGFTGSDEIIFTWTQANDEGSFDEWALAGAGHFATAATLDPVPIPAAIWMFGSALVGLFGFKQRKIS